MKEEGRQGDIADSRRDLHRLGNLCPSKRKAAGIPVIRTGPPPGITAGPAEPGPDRGAFRAAGGRRPPSAAITASAGWADRAMG